MTGTDWLDQLNQKAAAATAGEWVQNGRNGIHTPVGSCIATTHRHEDDQRKADAEFIAAANPHTVQRLINEHRALLRGSRCPECSASAWGELGDLRRERDALAAKVAAVREVLGEVAHEDVFALDAALRAALSDGSDQ